MTELCQCVEFYKNFYNMIDISVECMVYYIMEIKNVLFFTTH